MQEIGDIILGILSTVGGFTLLILTIWSLYKLGLWKNRVDTSVRKTEHFNHEIGILRDENTELFRRVKNLEVSK